MLVDLLSIVLFTFTLGLLVLGGITWWLERGLRRNFGLAMIAVAVFIAAAYAFLASRWSIALFGRLIVTVDLPRLIFTALIYTAGVLIGIGMATIVFLWVSRHLTQPSIARQQVAWSLLVILIIGLALSGFAILISHP